MSAAGPGLWLRSAAFVALAYALMLVMGLAGAPVVLWRAAWTRAWNKLYIRMAFALMRRLCGLRVEVRGEIPRDDVVIAAKHQSLLDVLALYLALPEPRFVMKKSLMWMPVFGLFARRTGAVPIDRRGGQGTARRLMEAFRGRPGQIVVYPQGTRVPPGARAPWRRGAAHLQAALGRPLVLVATNGGWFWPRTGILRRPGVAVIEIVERHPPGLSPDAAQALIEARVEAASDRLGAEAAGMRGRGG
jgi:1-acyl-sn-glycerol-3-phosphate acyltransferase